VTGVAGLVLGLVLARRLVRRRGATSFLAQHMATPELDVAANRAALKSQDPAEVATALRHLVDLGTAGEAARGQVEDLTKHGAPDVQALARRALRAIEGDTDRDVDDSRDDSTGAARSPWQ